MNLLTLNIDTIPLGQPLSFVLRSASGAVLAQKGYVIRNRAELDLLVQRGVHLCVDTEESDDSHRAYMGQLQRMLLSEKPLSEIAKARMEMVAQGTQGETHNGPPNWPDLQHRATQLLRSPPAHEFGTRFMELQADLSRYCVLTPDATLLALVRISGQETRMYSATHSMLVACVCMVVARATLRWDEEQILRIGCAALSMNCAMTELQDHLALQTTPLSAEQISAIENHPERSETLLRSLGIHDPIWLEAVRQHHHRTPGPLAHKTEAQQMARLIQRADIFSARLAPRVGRHPMPVTAAMQSCYYDEEHQVDEAGAAIVKTLGVYPPGTFVRLVSQEVGMVVRRGVTATTPRVAVVLNRQGMPTGELIPRDTAMPHWKITGVVAHKDVLRIQVPLERLLAVV
ncbi:MULTISPECIES: HD-GYP domain-containing protein [Giesbergeria]|uniref:HD-GYP domain-containing protein n=1 Tax=Giesbergeria sinuosa TaxID=80883 RepID=A0ABV9QHD5_9BURK